MSDRRDARDGEANERRGRTAAEWITFAISIAIVLATVGVVSYLYLTGGGDPPIVAAEALTDQIRQDGETYYLPIAVTNRGGRTAEQVMIESELTAGTEPPEVSEFTLDFLAGNETATGFAVFASDPAAGELTVDIVSYR